MTTDLAKKFPELVERGPALYAVSPVALRGRKHTHPVHGVALYGGFFNVLPGCEDGEDKPQRLQNSFRARSADRQSLPPEVQEELFADKRPDPLVVLLPDGLNEDIQPSGLYKPAGTSLSFFVDESVGRRCADDFRALIDTGHEPFLDYAHLGAKYKAADVRDVYYAPTQGVVAAVDWCPWAAKEILSGSCDSFSPVFFVSDDSRLEFEGMHEEIGGLLHRSMPPGLPRLKGSIKPVTKLQDLVFRAGCIKRLVAEAQRTGPADAENKLKRRMPAYYAAFTRHADLERQYGPGYYFLTK